MAGRGKTVTATDINVTTLIEKMGQVTATLERAREDRTEFRNSFDMIHSGMDAIRNELTGIRQTLQSTSTQVASIAQEQCGARLDKLEAVVFSPHMDNFVERLRTAEAKIATWDKWIGRGWTMAGRAALALLASGSVGAALLSFVRDHWH